MAFAYEKVGGATFKVNAGFEEREGRTICRWILVWQEIDDSTLAGALAGYSGGGVSIWSYSMRNTLWVP